MKKVFNSASDVIHLFAQQTQDKARCGNVFFEGHRIWSYGRHYLLAEFIYNNNIDEAIYINDRGYSSTTAKHISIVTGATRQYKQFFEMHINPDRVLSQLDGYAKKLSNARKPEIYINNASYLYDKYTEYIKWNGGTNNKETHKKIQKIYSVFIDEKNKEKYFEYLKKEANRIKREEQKRKLAILKQQKESINKFLNYELDSVYGIEEDYCRVSKDGTMIETTQRVRVDINEARMLFKMIQSGKDVKGFKIGGYTVIGLNGTLKIGCHCINTDNMKEIGNKIISVESE